MMIITPEAAVDWGGRVAIIGWIVLILLPRRWTMLTAIPTYVLPFVLGMGYCGIMLTFFGRVEGGYGSFTAIRTLFKSDEILAAGWLHYLAFDLFVGAWIARESDVIGLSRLLQAPILAITFWFGPGGLVLFLVTRLGIGMTSALGAQS
jgi:Domain of unknown function (DUF4281)